MSGGAPGASSSAEDHEMGSLLQSALLEVEVGWEEEHEPVLDCDSEIDPEVMQTGNVYDFVEHMERLEAAEVDEEGAVDNSVPAAIQNVQLDANRGRLRGRGRGAERGAGGAAKPSKEDAKAAKRAAAIAANNAGWGALGECFQMKDTPFEGVSGILWPDDRLTREAEAARDKEGHSPLYWFKKIFNEDAIYSIVTCTNKHVEAIRAAEKPANLHPK